jgi:Na+/H+-dicarboxylate symporter
MGTRVGSIGAAQVAGSRVLVALLLLATICLYPVFVHGRQALMRLAGW